jgi:hypothetical protein
MSEAVSNIYSNPGETPVTRITFPTLAQEILAAHAAVAALDRDTDPDYSKRDAIWETGQAGMLTMIDTAAVNLADIRAKVMIAVAIESDYLNASIFRDVLALVD